ncbi:MAG: hypothetical protein IPH26_08700 [Sterolibacteriaceae bacterium]|uniref:Uncharacterized protein n=1 Tax=Candidatus Methylophosphatis roskildensis TaxID=2899263 RepID=A0A9D7HLG9_9PROT|nr:hypothetical protein [Candidatus Methylophosphatis roskildensis]MBK7237583.1 hypothetical protein [Sterolibacteriaceae bacterium]
MPDKYFPDEKEPHIHEFAKNKGIGFTDARHRHTTLLDGDELREPACIKVIDDLKAKPTAREQQIIDYIKALVRKHKKGR